VVVMIAMKFKNSFQGRMDKIVDNVGNQIDQAAANSN
jgi:hypothetical protein